MADEISLDTNPPQQPQISLDAQAPTTPISSDVAGQRAFKAKQGLPNFEYSYSDLYSSFMSGMEPATRQSAAAYADFQKEGFRQDAISSIASQMNRPLTQQEVGSMHQLISAPVRTDPQSVFEEYYPMEYLDNVRRTGEVNPSPWVLAHPDQVNETFFRGRDYMSKQEVVRTFLENAEEVLKAQGYPGYLIDQAKNLVPGYMQIKERGLMNEPFFHGALGTNLDEQSRNYFNGPFEQSKAAFLAQGNQMLKDNPSLALSWAHAILGQSYSEEMLNNMAGLLDIPAGGLAKLGANALRKLLPRGAEVYAQQAVKSAVKQAGREGASRAAMAEAAGNIPEAGVQEITKDMLVKMKAITDAAERGATSDVHFNPISTELKSLPDTFLGAINELDSNPTNLRQGYVAMLREQYNLYGNRLMRAINDTIKVNRIPVVDAVEQESRKIADAMVGEYPGLENRIQNNKLRYDPGTNIHWIDYYIGGTEGRLFDTENTARNLLKSIGFEKIGRVEEVYGPHLVKGGIALKPPAQILKETGLKSDEALKIVKSTAWQRARDLEMPAKILQQGPKFTAVISKPLPATAYAVREGILKMPGAQIPTGWLTSKIGKFITPNETLSEQQSMQRIAATVGPSNFYDLIRDNAKDIRALRSFALPFTTKRQKWNQWRDVIANIQQMRDDVTGKLNPTLNNEEFSQLYQNKFHRAPDEAELSAYHAHKREELFIKTFDALNEFKDLHNTGSQQHTIYTTVANQGTERSVPLTKHSFYGTSEPHFPKTDDPVMIVDAAGNTQIVTTNRLGPKMYAKYKEMVEKGEYKSIKLSRPQEYQFDGVIPGKEGARVSHVLAEKLDTENINWQNLGRNRLPDYDYDHYASQAIVRHDPLTGKAWLEGERTLAAFQLRAIGKPFIEKVNQIRLLLKAGKDAEAEAFHAGAGLPFEWSTMRGWFKGDLISAKPVINRIASAEYKAFVDSGEMEVGEGFRTRPILSLDDPVRLVSRHERINNLDNELANRYNKVGTTEEKDIFRDGTKGRYDKGFDNGYRDIFTIKNIGTRENPIHDVVPVPHLDPMVSIGRAMSRVLKSNFMNDYKAFSIEHWIQEAKDFLNVNPGELAQNPYYYFFNSENLWKQTADNYEKVQALKTARLQIQQFIGMQDANTTFLHSMAQKLADSLYEKGHTTLALAPTWLLPTLRDPFSVMRSLTMDAKMGMFAIPQLLVQANTFTNIFGIAGPKYAVPGTKAMLLHQYARYNSSPEMLAHLDKLASTRIIPGTSVFLPGQFTEARQLLAKTGWEHVGGEYIKIDSPWLDIVHAERQSFLNAGRVFFREGEKSTRIGAWYTAYKEFRDARPTGAIKDNDLKQILLRADLLTTNMTRASASAMHKGVWSLPTQFLSYQMRLAELFMGKRLTNVEKARGFAANAMMYGIPMGFGLTGLPINDWLRKEAVENNYVVGDNWFNSLLTEGLPSTLLALITGKGDTSKGTYYNVGSRYGSGGFDPIREALISDKPFLDVMGGAAVSTFSNTIGNLSPVYQSMMSMIRQDGKHKLTVNDFIDPFTEIASVNSAKRLYYAFNIGKWISRKEASVDDVSMGSAIFQTLTGLSTQRAEDVNTSMRWSAATEKKRQAEGLSLFIEEYHRAIQDQNNGDPDQFEARTKRALTYLEMSGYPHNRISDALALAGKGWENQIDQVTREYYTSRNVSESRQQGANDAYLRQLELNKRKNEQ